MKKILVIEDEELVRDGVVELLSNENYDVSEASNGMNGLLKAQKLVPDLIICDVMMPGLNGFELIDALHQDQATATIPFIFLTAKTERRDFRHGMDLGADDFLTKPFKSEELIQTVKSRLSKQEKIETKSKEMLNELRLNIATILPHELRTPLNGILASSQLLLEYSDSMYQEEIIQLYENINASAKRLNRLIVNYLYYSELELLNKDKKRIKYFKKISNIPNPSIYFLDQFKSSAKSYERENDISFDLSDSNIVIFEDHFQKIIEEIADNALKFSEAGTKIQVLSKIETEHYVVEIIDNGRGMNSDRIEKIGAYVQFDRNIYEQQGSGMGLIIVKSLLNLYHCTLEIDSVLEEYTKIILKFPMASADGTDAEIDDYIY